ncbi:MAG: hypothetical protein GY835_16540 [bacterium]|nr:hypothetical protein [bacterium]
MCLPRGAPFVVAKDKDRSEGRVHALLSEIHVIGGVAEFVDNCIEDNVVEIFSDVIDAYHAYVEEILGRCNLIDAWTAVNRHSWRPIINLTF